MDYNQTIHLPQTDFPMRAGLPKREPEMLQAMYDKDLYHKMVGRNDGKPLFVLHDGPPYANGSIHIGTALNKILKDIIVKEKNMTGYCSPYVPGWDTHGLPIESAILKDKKVKRDELTTSEFREKCKEYALSFVDKQREQFKRLGVLGEWDDPYLTLKPAFEAKQVEIFGKMAEKGFIYKGMKPVYWCPHDQTALAEAEIEYQDDPCTTLFVKFPVRDDQGKLGGYADLSKTYFVIWTTRPGPSRATWPSASTPSMTTCSSRPPTARSISWPRTWPSRSARPPTLTLRPPRCWPSSRAVRLSG